MLTNETLSNATLLGFMKESVRFSFTNHEDIDIEEQTTPEDREIDLRNTS